MMNKNNIKITKKIKYIFILNVMLFYVLNPNIVYGNTSIYNDVRGQNIKINAIEVASTTSLDDIIQNGNNFLNAADDSTNTVDEEDLQNLSKFMSGVLLSIAIGVTIISGVVLGIKFVTQSIEDKAKIKEAMIPWIVGIIVSFGAFTIWKISINFFQNI